MPTNRLVDETSPYLLQHAHNPVDWYPWGREALQRARETDRPIFLSIGYAACHWCHVMEHESFEDSATAAYLNAHFVPIKVDREERPDLDALYMEAVQAMTGSGGWPMSVFLTPDGRPFFGGTYFPSQRRQGLPGFRDVLVAVTEAWQERRGDVEVAGSRLADAIRAAATDRGDKTALVSGAQPLDPALPDQAVAALQGTYDALNGGWGGAPKFPQPAVLDFLLGRPGPHAEAVAHTMALHTLDRMVTGGIHDQVGGGFHRYATDAIWRVPHFEKMLYDNAQLARTYVTAHRLTGRRAYREAAGRTLDYLLREMALPEGGFAASQDADAGGEEGATYVWRWDEIQAVLGDEAPLAEVAFGVTAAGNWEGRSILERPLDDEALGARFGLPVPDVERRLAGIRTALLAARNNHPQPSRDDKVIVAWNGLVVAALADAGVVFGRTEYLEAAIRTADFLLGAVRTREGRLRHSWRVGRTSVDGFLDDHAHFAEGLLALYQATFDERWFVAARALMDEVLAHFADPRGGFFDVRDDHEVLLARPQHLEDGGVPSGNAMAVTVLLRLAALTGDARYRAAAEQALARAAPYLVRWPTGFGQWLTALDLAVGGIDEVAIVGDLREEATVALVEIARRRHRMRQVVAVSPRPRASRIELLQSRFALNGRPTAFVCRDFACRQPVTEPEALAAQLSV